MRRRRLGIHPFRGLAKWHGGEEEREKGFGSTAPEMSAAGGCQIPFLWKEHTQCRPGSDVCRRRSTPAGGTATQREAESYRVGQLHAVITALHFVLPGPVLDAPIFRSMSGSKEHPIALIAPITIVLTVWSGSTCQFQQRSRLLELDRHAGLFAPSAAQPGAAVNI